MKIWGIPADRVNDLATGLTLAGVGCTGIISNIISNLKRKFVYSIRGQTL